MIYVVRHGETEWNAINKVLIVLGVRALHALTY